MNDHATKRIATQLPALFVAASAPIAAAFAFYLVAYMGGVFEADHEDSFPLIFGAVALTGFATVMGCNTLAVLTLVFNSSSASNVLAFASALVGALTSVAVGVLLASQLSLAASTPSLLIIAAYFALAADLKRRIRPINESITTGTN